MKSVSVSSIPRDGRLGWPSVSLHYVVITCTTAIFAARTRVAISVSASSASTGIELFAGPHISITRLSNDRLDIVNMIVGHVKALRR
jgi:hypothetical protein